MDNFDYWLLDHVFQPIADSFQDNSKNHVVLAEVCILISILLRYHQPYHDKKAS